VKQQPKISVEAFFELFLKELESHEALHRYYKFLDDPAKLPFRKVYFCQRLQYILDRISEEKEKAGKRDLQIWDCGCGYATTQIFLALNGHASRGSTLEFYFKELPQRLKFWAQHGDMNLVKVDYEDVFEAPVQENSTDVIIVQDTLHHLEPLQDSLRIFRQTLKPGGLLLAIEENGNNIIQNLKLYRQRGNKRIITFYDEGLGREVTMGNENIRPWKKWRQELLTAGLQPEDEKIQYIRLFPPFWFRNKNAEAVTAREQRLWRRHPLLKEYFFFGVNFTARKT
jgi:SAM-dependent methyltransferase